MATDGDSVSRIDGLVQETLRVKAGHQVCNAFGFETRPAGCNRFFWFGSLDRAIWTVPMPCTVTPLN